MPVAFKLIVVLRAVELSRSKDSIDRRLIDLAGESRGEFNEPSAFGRWQNWARSKQDKLASQTLRRRENH